MQERNKKYILNFFALVLSVMYVIPMGYCLGLWIGAIIVAIIFLPLTFLITTKSYDVALNITLFYAGLTIIHVLSHIWALFYFLKGAY